MEASSIAYISHGNGMVQEMNQAVSKLITLNKVKPCRNTVAMQSTSTHSPSLSADPHSLGDAFL